jgi:lipopolysaccharide assembly protein A
MHKLLWLLRWILKAAIFFTLFAFALNNQHEVVAHFFFGRQWAAPLVVIVLIAFTAGLVMGVLGMVPRWWRQRKVSKKLQHQALNQTQNSTTQPAPNAAQRAQDGAA